MTIPSQYCGVMMLEPSATCEPLILLINLRTDLWGWSSANIQLRVDHWRTWWYQQTPSVLEVCFVMYLRGERVSSELRRTIIA